MPESKKTVSQICSIRGRTLDDQWHGMAFRNSRSFSKRSFCLTHEFIGVHASSIVNEVSGQFRVCLFFLRKDFEREKKTPKQKTNDFHPLWSFCARKKLLLLLFFIRSFLFCYLVFACDVFFYAQNLFVKKIKINRPKIVLIASFTILLSVAKNWLKPESMPLITMYRAVVLQLLVNRKHHTSYCPTPIHLFWTYSELF